MLWVFSYNREENVWQWISSFLFFAGALTKGDRRAATGADLTQFNFDTPYGRSALKNMYQAISVVGTYIILGFSKHLDSAWQSNVMKSISKYGNIVLISNSFLFDILSFAASTSCSNLLAYIYVEVISTV